MAKILSCLFGSCLYVIFKKYKTFSVLIYSYINTSENWRNEKLCGNTTPAERSVFIQFRVFPIFTSIDITVYQHGKCFIFLKYNIKTRTEETRKDFCHRQNIILICFRTLHCNLEMRTGDAARSCKL